MKKTLSFEKDLTFQTMIGEVSTISFEDDLKFVDKSNIEGNFYISGKYKMTEASTLTEDFSFSVPIEIAMMEVYDLTTTKISIENFNYEVIDDDVLRCKIDILIEGREEVVLEDEKSTLDEKVLDRECDDDDVLEEEKEIPIKEDKKDNEKVEEAEVVEEEEKLNNNINIDMKQDINMDIIQNIESKKDNEEKEKRDEEVVGVVEDKPKNTTIKVNSLFANLGDDNDTFTTYSVYIMREGDTVEKVMDQYQVKKEDLEMYNDLSTIQLNSKVIIPTSSDE